MQIEKLSVANIKCGGCADIITEGLQAVPGIDAVQVDVSAGIVEIHSANAFSSDLREQVSRKLTELGYPVR